MNTKYKYLLVEIENQIATVTINREDKLNALNKEVLQDLKSCFENIEKNTDILAVIITGSGEKAYIAGADISAMSDMDPEAGREFAEFGQGVTVTIENCSKPVIAAVNGYALGGGLEFALCADFIYATENALFGLPEVSLGLIPGFGGTQRLSKIIGRNRAKEMIYTGKNISAMDAKSYGLALEVFTNKDELLAGAKKTISKMAKNSPFAIGQAKKVINLGVDEINDIGLKKESETFGAIFASYDMKEGTKAFAEKRKPEFKGE